MKRIAAFCFFLLSIGTIAHAQQKGKTYLFVGSYTGGKPDRGIHVFSFNSKSGALKEEGAAYDLTNPSYITLSPDGQYLYACADTKMPDTGSVMSFKIDSLNGSLKFLNRQSSGGDNPVYLSVDHSGRYIINANYSGGSVSVFKTNTDGSLQPRLQNIFFPGSSIVPDRQEKSHIHAAVYSPQCDFVFLPDLGTDKIWIFGFDTTQAQPLERLKDYQELAIPGSGPRHFTFHPGGQFAYCIEELSGMVSSYTYHNGMLDSIQRIYANSNSHELCRSADIHISPDGRFLYVSNRDDGENNIAIFSIDQAKGMLTFVGHQSTYGDHPRNFTIDPTGRFLLVANMASNTIVVFRRDMKTGLLKKTKTEIRVPSPSCLQMRSFGKEQGARGSEE